MGVTCPSCGATFADDPHVCRSCFFVIDQERWHQQHDPGRLGPDGRDLGKEPEDPPVGPVPATWGGAAGGFVDNTSHLMGLPRILRRRRRPRR